MTENPTDTDVPFRVELYFRGDTYGGFGPRQMVDWAKRLAASGEFDEPPVTRTWPRVQTRGGDRRSAAMDTYEVFRKWAGRNGLSLEPGFQRRARSFVGVDDVEEVVVFPAIALALYGAGDLVAVFPCTDDDRTYTVERALAAFEHDDQSWLTQFEPLVTDRPGPRLEPEVTMN